MACCSFSKSMMLDSSLNPYRTRRKKKAGLGFKVVSAFSYQKFIHFALDETQRHVHLVPSPLQDKYSSMMADDGKAELQMVSFKAPKVRLLRSLCIEAHKSMQVLDFAVFPEPKFDLPIFCANFFTSANANIVVLVILRKEWEVLQETFVPGVIISTQDLNPLYDVANERNYMKKYYESLMPLGVKYSELLPWGGKLTSESLKFFSPLVIWTKFTSGKYKHDVLYSAFVDYYKAWLELMDQAVEETEASRIICNREAQHRYLTWRAEKDPGHRVLKNLIGETLAKDLVRSFLFDGMDELGKKTFLDYFPEYQCEDGTVNEKRSVMGKSFENRPWNARGEFMGHKSQNHNPR